MKIWSTRVASATLFVAVATFSSASRATDLFDAVESFFYGGPSGRPEVICTADVSTEAKDITEAIERALRLYEVLQYSNPSRRPQIPEGFEKAARCLWEVSARATPRGMVYGAFFAPSPIDRLARVRRAAELGDVDAMWRMAREPAYVGPRVERVEEYRKWRDLAAKAGHPSAQLALASALRGEARDLERTSPDAKEKIISLHQSALRWSETYVLNSNPHSVSCSQDALPKAYFSEVQRCFASKAYEKAIIAQYYYEGRFGVPRDYDRAATFVTSAIADGVYAEGEMYAHMLENGLGVPRDPAAASEVRRKTEEWRRNRVLRSGGESQVNDGVDPVSWTLSNVGRKGGPRCPAVALHTRRNFGKS